MTGTELGKTARTGVYWSLSLKGGQQLYHFVVLIIVARILSPAEFGIMAVSTSIITYLNSLTSVGLTSAIVQQDKLDDGLVNAIFSLNIILSVIFVPVCCYLSPLLAKLLNASEIENVLPVLSILIPLSTFYTIPMALLRRNMNFKLHAIVDLCQFTTHSTVMLILALLGYGVWSLVYSAVAGYSLAAVLLLVIVKWKPRFSFNLKSIANVYGYGLWESLRFHMSYLEENAANLIISRFLGPVMLGYYERAGSIASIPMRKIQLHISSVTFAVFSRIQYETDKLEETFSKTFLMVAFFIIPLLVGMALVAPYFVVNAFGAKWEQMIIPMQILSVAGIFKILSDSMIVINVAVNQYRKQAIANTLSTLFLLALCVFCVRYGIIGVAVGILFSSIVNYCYCCYITSIAMHITLLNILRNVMLPSIGAISMIIVAVVAKLTFSGRNGIFELITVIVLCALAYIVTMIFLPDKSIKQLLRLVISDFNAKRLELGIFCSKT